MMSREKIGAGNAGGSFSGAASPYQRLSKREYKLTVVHAMNRYWIMTLLGDRV